ncbi:MAG: hypothetical protein EA390_01825 [Balneolaceae bacterium]|nr:MAG: hypothetical protein EA390_01825 [Balneolaceae bacterium]
MKRWENRHSVQTDVTTRIGIPVRVFLLCAREQGDTFKLVFSSPIALGHEFVKKNYNLTNPPFFLRFCKKVGFFSP